MAVKDFMTRKVVYISPDTTVAHAADLMREQGLHRLPVIENDKLVGLVTEGTIAEASPSKATSLSTSLLSFGESYIFLLIISCLSVALCFLFLFRKSPKEILSSIS